VTGIHTGTGKTVASAILCKALAADYWKPIQAGDTHQTDSDNVRSLVDDSSFIIHPEAYLLPYPLSPDISARKAGITINLDNINIPHTRNNLVIEGAGGLMVPLNDKHLLIDLISKLEAEVILVSRHYLGSINHTLLSIEALINRNIPV